MELHEMKTTEKTSRRNRRTNAKRDKAKQGSYAKNHFIFRNRHNGKGAPSGRWINCDNSQSKVRIDQLIADQLDSTSIEVTLDQPLYAVEDLESDIGITHKGNFCSHDAA